MKNPRTKKYPIFTYLCWLLVVAMLFTGVTFSRYSITQSGSLSTDVANFNCGYTVDNISSFNFINNDYIEEGTASGTGARTVRFSLRNYDSDNVISAVALDGNIRLYLPADLADNLAIQVRTDRVVTTENGQKTSLTNVVYSPQITLGDVLYYGGTDSNGHIERGDSYYNFGTDETNPTVLSTDDFSDSSVYEHISRNLSVTGGLSKTNTDGKLSASGTVKIQTSADGSTDPNGVSITISAETATIPYNIGFQRGGTAPALYLDLEREEIYYTIDISVPYMQYEANIATESEHVVFFTLVEKVDSSIHWQIGATDPDDGSYTTTLCLYEDGKLKTDYSKEQTDGVANNMDVLITTPPASNQEYRIVRTYQDNTPDVDTDNPVEYAKVLGYHFEQDAAMLKTDGTEGYEDTTVRVKCTYNNAGGYDVSLYHVAQVNEGDGYYVHPITFGNTSSTVIENVSYKYTFDSYFTGKCQSDSGRTISLSYIQANPFTYLDWEVNADGKIPDSVTSRTVEMSALVSRSYYLRMHAVFVQASQTPSQGGN
ncbi:MAG TPA: hypothetical protein IAC67_02895 [Candidatus Coproplasma excrementipullorum]|nr:hypothetical protein [Candidatus Coproplasma excrementipullorum]